MKIVNIHKAKTSLSALIQMVLDGQAVIIANNNKPVVELKKIEESSKRSLYGALKNDVWEAEDCWETDKELIDSFYKD